MSLAGDKLYSGYLRRKMPTIVSKVKVRDIINHLSCLTADDRANIEAKRETCGNYDGMVLLLDCLKRTENWPEQFIKALEACDQKTIAAEIRAEYNALKGADDSNPSSPPTTVVRAHVHPAPSASSASLPESGGGAQAADAPPAPAEPAIQVIPSLEITTQPQAPQSTEDQVSSSKPVAEPPRSTLIEVPAVPSTPPPSPETPHIEVTFAPLSQKEINSLLAPVENLKSDVHDGATPDSTSSGNDKQAHQPSGPDPEEDRPPQSPSPAQMSPKKPPVQDATLPAASVLQPDKTSESPAAQIVEPGPAAIDDGVCPSKPEQLVSVQPQSPTVPASIPDVDSSSVNSKHLEISQAAPACSAVKTVTAQPCQENGFAPKQNKPAEKLETQEVKTVQVSEEPSIPKLAPQAQIVNGEVAKETTSALPPSSGAAAAAAVSSANTPSTASYSPSEPATKTLQNSEETSRLQTPLTPSANRKYVMTAVGVGACAMLMAWKMKN